MIEESDLQMLKDRIQYLSKVSIQLKRDIGNSKTKYKKEYIAKKLKKNNMSLVDILFLYDQVEVGEDVSNVEKS